MYTVRIMADGEHYYAPRTFEGHDCKWLAESFYDSSLDRIRREDGPYLEVTVDLIDNSTDDVLYSETFPALPL